MFELYAPEAEIAQLRSVLLAGGEIDRVKVLIKLAWHLRQRDPRRALELADSAEPLLSIPYSSRSDLDGLRGRLKLVRAEVAGLYTEFDLADCYLAEASALLNAPDDSLGRGDVAFFGAFLARLKGDVKAEREGWSAAVDLFSRAGDGVRAASAEAWSVIASVPLARGPDQALRADLIERPLPGGSLAVDALRCMGDGLISEGTQDPARSATAWTRAYDHAKATGLIYVAICSALLAARSFRRLGNPEAARGWCERGYELARPTGWPHMLGACHILSGSLLYDLKEFDRSYKALIEAVPLSGPHRALCHLFLARTQLALNRPEAALETLDKVGGCCESLDDPLIHCSMLIERARALAGVTRYGEAADQIEVARAIARKAGVTDYDVVLLEVMATLYENSYLPGLGGRSPAQATYECLKEAFAVGSSSANWRPTTALLTRLARAAAGNDDPIAAIGYYERALIAADQETTRRMENWIAANKIQDDLSRARRDAELYDQRRRAAIEGRRADDLQAALDAMHAAQKELAQRTAEFERLSLVDPLTGIANRRHLDNRVAAEVATIVRKSTSLGLILFDIDRFKGINDVHGHDFGDHVICEVVKIASAQLRPSDFIARMGGDEFTILLPETNLEGVKVIANRIRLAVSERKIAFHGTALSVTASFGITVLTPDQQALDAALKRADTALYLAKESGRNCVFSQACGQDSKISSKN